MLAEARKIITDPKGYVAAVRDWVEHGAAEPVRAVARGGRRPIAAPPARARPGGGGVRARTAPVAQRPPRRAPRWFREAHRLHPDNWTYKRQAWAFADPLQGPTDLYDSDWLSDIQAIGAENYYPHDPW